MCIQHSNPFRLNHVGFPKQAAKRFVYVEDGPGDFTLKRMQDGVFTNVFTGRMERREADAVAPACRTGDFSAVEEEGVYRLFCGEKNSRTFYIYDKIYDPVCRMLTSFFVWQRCGDDAGWNGPCHRQDRLIDRCGVEHRLTGGHHQSGDLRKWAFGVPAGIYGLSEYLRLEHPLWNRGVIEYDVAHAARYYLARTSEEGYVYDCSFVPEDYDEKRCAGVGFQDYGAFWRSFRYFDRPTDPLGHWMTLRMLASAALTLGESDPVLAEECRAGARRIWDYMMKTGRYTRDFDWTVYPPIGHSDFKKTIFDRYYPDSAWMLCGECYAGMALYRAEPDEAIQQQVAASLRTLAGYMVKAKDGALAYFRMSAADPTPAENAKYFSLHLPLAFSEALRLWPDHGDAALWRDCCAAALKKYQAQAAANAYGLTTDFCSTADGWKTMDWGYYAPSFNMDLSYTALFLSEIAPLFGRENCLPLAQRLLDFVIGANPADISSVEGVGYNQPQRAVFGEFFPAQPQIPGGVFTDFQPVEPDYSGFGLEYDMPIVGGYLYALSYYSRAVAEP